MMNSKDALLKEVQFNPFFLYTLKHEFPDLQKKGFIITVIETLSPEGRFVSGSIKKKEYTLDLGTVKISEKGIEPISGLRPYTDLVEFVRLHE